MGMWQPFVKHLAPPGKQDAESDKAYLADRLGVLELWELSNAQHYVNALQQWIVHTQIPYVLGGRTDFAKVQQARPNCQLGNHLQYNVTISLV